MKVIKMKKKKQQNQRMKKYYQKNRIKILQKVKKYQQEHPELRKEYFKKYGWDCIVFRTDKLDEQLVVEQVGKKLVK